MSSESSRLLLDAEGDNVLDFEGSQVFAFGLGDAVIVGIPAEAREVRIPAERTTILVPADRRGAT